MSDAAPPARRRRRRRVPGWVIFVVLVVVVVGATVALRSARGPVLPTVVAETPVRGEFLREVTGSGVVESVRERAIGFRSGGTVAEVFVEAGDRVTDGQTVARLDVAEVQRSLASVEASLASARADRARAAAQLEVDRLDLSSAVAQAEDALEAARREVDARAGDVDRVQRLQELGTASRDDLRIAEDALEAAEATVRQAEASLRTARTRESNETALADAQSASAEAQISQLETERANLLARLDDAALTAPFAGVVASVTVSVGDVVGTQAVVTIADPDALRVRADFDENRASALRVGQPADVVPDADTRLRLAGAVERLAPVASRDGSGAQVEARVTFADTTDLSGVRAGYTVTARVRVARIEDAWLVPLEAISEDEDGSFLFVIREATEEAPATVARIAVTPLDRNATVAAVPVDTDGLGADVRIVVVGVDAVQDGDAVTIDGDPPPARRGFPGFGGRATDRSVDRSAT